ncbi:hypothetical protein KKA14_10775 [bacterium]|nr:hypothetical protein [bacterium]
MRFIKIIVSIVRTFLSFAGVLFIYKRLNKTPGDDQYKFDVDSLYDNETDGVDELSIPVQDDKVFQDISDN